MWLQQVSIIHKHYTSNSLVVFNVQFYLYFMYYADEKTPTISLFNNSEKLVQILIEFCQ